MTLSLLDRSGRAALVTGPARGLLKKPLRGNGY
jgi:hypothetical protein